MKRIQAVLVRLALGVAIWWLLTDGAADSWSIGVPVVVIALGASMKLMPPGRLRFSLLGALTYAGFFAWQSLRAGLDVARRALRPQLDLTPVLVAVRTELPAGLPRVVLANTLSLLPGSLVVHLDGERILLHLLDRTSDAEAELARVEARIAQLFGLTLEGKQWR